MGKREKSIGWNTAVAWEFYDLKNEPEELNNWYNGPKYKAIIVSLKEEILKHRTELNETDKNYSEIQKSDRQTLVLLIELQLCIRINFSNRTFVKTFLRV